MTESEEKSISERDSWMEKLLEINEHNTILLERLSHKYESFVEPSTARLLQLNTSQGDKISDNLKMNQMILSTLQYMQAKNNSQENVNEMEKKIDYIYDTCVAELYLEIATLKKKQMDMLFEMKQMQIEVKNLGKSISMNSCKEYLDPIGKCCPIEENKDEEEIQERDSKSETKNEKCGEHSMRFIAALQPCIEDAKIRSEILLS